MIFHTSGVHGLIATEEKVVIPSNNYVLKVGRERSVGILTKVETEFCFLVFRHRFLF